MPFGKAGTQMPQCIGKAEFGQTVGSARPFPALHGDSLIRLENVTVRLRDRHVLTGTSWEIRQGEQWAVLGPNGAGKSTLVRVLTGEVPVVVGRVDRGSDPAAVRVGCVSFERHRRILERDERLDDARHFSGAVDVVTTVRDHLLQAGVIDPETGVLPEPAGRLVRGPLLDRGLRHLSTGEIKRVLIAEALAGRPRLLVLDEPFEGLDPQGRFVLRNSLEDLMFAGTQIVLVTHRIGEIPDAVSHVIRLKDCRVVAQGTRREMLQSVSRQSPVRRFPFTSPVEEFHGGESDPQAEPVIVMRNVSVAYGRRTVLRGVTWTLRRGENWAIQGPNGAGKSTLLAMIAGDHPQAYANEVHLFGRRRGTGESIWEIRERIGMISPELQLRYRKHLTALEVVISGLFDTIGLYRGPGAIQRETATRWMERLGVGHLAGRPFDRLSQGEQRMVLLARSMVKSPEILILDEPCQGLDPWNRREILDIVDRIGSESETDLLYVTHHPEEVPGAVTHRLVLVPGEDGAAVARFPERRPRIRPFRPAESTAGR